VPRISEFYGIVIYMYYDDHEPPHFHASYGGEEAMFDLKGNLIKGTLPKRALALIREWAMENQSLIVENWNLARDYQPLKWIKPLL